MSNDDKSTPTAGYGECREKCGRWFKINPGMAAVCNHCHAKAFDTKDLMELEKQWGNDWSPPGVAPQQRYKCLNDLSGALTIIDAAGDGYWSVQWDSTTLGVISEERLLDRKQFRPLTPANLRPPIGEQRLCWDDKVLRTLTRIDFDDEVFTKEGGAYGSLESWLEQPLFIKPVSRPPRLPGQRWRLYKKHMNLTIEGTLVQLIADGSEPFWELKDVTRNDGMHGVISVFYVRGWNNPETEMTLISDVDSLDREKEIVRLRTAYGDLSKERNNLLNKLNKSEQELRKVKDLVFQALSKLRGV